MAQISFTSCLRVWLKYLSAFSMGGVVVSNSRIRELLVRSKFLAVFGSPALLSSTGCYIAFYLANAEVVLISKPNSFQQLLI